MINHCLWVLQPSKKSKFHWLLFLIGRDTIHEACSNTQKIGTFNSDFIVFNS